ncbi:MAG: GTP-binding protein [Prolixibacteraceae bacterium]|nr:GTP-binding protein [Prolixibacteraceae bacterium]MBN2774957.1 GTP-binding protein [Prolixibacteraceae bacterium]
MEKIKTTLITGFLGAGKTTFINRLLKQYPGNKFALVENEFGEVAIDTKLIKGVDAGKMFELKNGCICCTIANEYELILLELAERFPSVEHLIIETTGMADPASVAKPFFTDEDIKNRFEYNGTVCLVDSVNFDIQPEKEISLKQIAVADLILINKCDLIDESVKNKLFKNITSINPLAEVLLVESGFSERFNLNSIISTGQKKMLHMADKPLHFHLISKTLTFNEPIEKEKFTDWLTYNLDIYKNQIYRIKGIVFFKDDPFKYILQGVGSGFEFAEDGFAFEKRSEIVFIGKLNNFNPEFY